jgi:DNA-binding FadR family transcriptional regulator
VTEAVLSASTVFAPVRSQTAFEETVERLGTAIKLGLLPPGARLPAERELCSRLGIARSTLRQALTALGQSGHVHATRGRGGGTFVADPLPPAEPPSRRSTTRSRTSPPTARRTSACTSGSPRRPVHRRSSTR